MASSAEGLKKKDLNHIQKKDEGNLSGSERSILADYKGLPPEDETADSQSKPEYKLTDEEAGYDQAAYDEEVDSMRDEEISASEAEAWKTINHIEDNVPIEKWNDLQKAQMEEMTGFTYDELVGAGVTKPDGMSIEQLLENRDE